MAAIREGRQQVGQEDFHVAVEKVLGNAIRDAQKVVKDAAFA
jgi:ATP-dependent 26S proteasome regulatory subunit